MPLHAPHLEQLPCPVPARKLDTYVRAVRDQSYAVMQMTRIPCLEHLPSGKKGIVDTTGRETGKHGEYANAKPACLASRL